MLLSAQLSAFMPFDDEFEIAEEDEEVDIEEFSDVYVPSFTPGFEFEISVMTLRPTFGDLDYATVIHPAGVNIEGWDVKAVRPQFTSAFDLGLGYYFGNSGNNIKISWLHHDTKDLNTVHNEANFIEPLFSAGELNGQYTHAKSTLWNHFDRIHLTAGQYIDAGSSFSLRVFAGVDFALLNQKLQTKFGNHPENIKLSMYQKCKFVGGGPILGLNMIYHFCDGLGLIGEISGACLMGNRQRHLSLKDTSIVGAEVGFEPETRQYIRPDSTTQTVFGGEAKVGINYAYSYCDCVVRIEAGYKAGIYLNALESIKPLTVATAPELGSVTVQSIGKSISDFGFGGPYVTLGFDF